jgi:homoserine O-succinyltransferase
MAIIIPQDNPVYSRLKNQGIAVKAETADSFRRAVKSPQVVTLGFVNLMPTIYLEETVDLLLARLAKADADIRPVFIHPEDSRKGALWDDAKTKNLDCVLVTGYAASNEPFENLTFWGELCRILDDVKEQKLPLFGVCAGAMAIANHHYGIAKERAPHKLLGNYEYKTTDGGSQLLATSRHNTLNRADLLQAIEKDGLQIIAETVQTPQPEPAVLIDPARNILLTLAHLEYSNGKRVYADLKDDLPRDIMTYQYDRDHNTTCPKYDPELAARVKPPVNAALSNEQVRSRERYAEKLLSAWVNQAVEFKLARNAKPAIHLLEAAYEQDRQPVLAMKHSLSA